MWNKLCQTAINYLKKKWWYVVLLFISSFYIYYYRNEIEDLSKFNAMNLIFILWLILLIYPLFSEIEIGSVKLKKEIEEVKETTKEAFRELRLQIMDMKISNANSNANTFVLNSTLPSEQELKEIRNNIKPAKVTDDEGRSLEEEIDISEQNVYLFKVRLAIEKRVNALCDKMNYDGGRTLMSSVRYLLKHEAINASIADGIEQIIHIANRGVHGEIVSSKYIDFVKEVAPGVLRELDEIENQYHICTKCGYSWYGDTKNICPNCESRIANYKMY